MSRLRHEKARQRPLAGAGSGVHRLEADKPLPFKPDEERKRGGSIASGKSAKLGRKRGGSVKKKRDDGGSVTSVAKTTPSDPPENYDTLQKSSLKYLSNRPYLRARELQGPLDQIGTTGVHPSYEWHDEAKKSGPKAQDRLSEKDGGKIDWIKPAVRHPGAERKAAKRAGESTHEYMESHKHDSGKSGARARLGLRLSAMSKHKD